MRAFPLFYCVSVFGMALVTAAAAAPPETPPQRTVKPAEPSDREKVRLENADLHRIDAADALLCRLQPQQALPVYQAILNARPRYDPPGSVDRKASAAIGCARVYAELGQFREALRLLDIYADRYASHCGSCQEERLEERHCLQRIWSAALQPTTVAETRLRAIAAGRFPVYVGRLNPHRMAEQKEAARREACLYLGELLLRQGRKNEVDSLFRVAETLPAHPGAAPDFAQRLGAAHRKAVLTPQARN